MFLLLSYITEEEGKHKNVDLDFCDLNSLYKSTINDAKHYPKVCQTVWSTFRVIQIRKANISTVSHLLKYLI